MRSFLNDPDGLSLADLVTMMVLPVWTYTAVKFALLPDISGNQVDYFLVLSYPLLIAVGAKALGTLPWPRRSRLTQLPVQAGGDDGRISAAPRLSEGTGSDADSPSLEDTQKPTI